MKAGKWLIILVCILAGCTLPSGKPPGEPDFPPATQTLPTRTPAPVIEIAVGPLDFGADINPLTGLKVDDARLLDRRPLAVKISNDPRPMRPQWGLTAADIVFEYYTEWGKTRFTAVFYGQDAALAGPIRSARFFDEHVVRMYRAGLAYVGADERVLKHFEKAEYLKRLVSEYPAGCPPICRVDSKMWNHAVTDTAQLSRHLSRLGVGNRRQELEGMRFESQVPPGGEPGEAALVRFSPYTYGAWMYDFSRGTYVRLQDLQDDNGGQGEAYELLNDRLTGEIVDAHNVAVIFAPYEYVVKKEDAEVVQVGLIGSGRAVLYRDGRAYPVTWLRRNKETMLTLVDERGMPFAFKPGRTWFEIVGAGTQVEDLTPSVRRYRFAIP